MLHTSLATQIQQCIAKPGFCVADRDVIPGKLCPVMSLIVRSTPYCGVIYPSSSHFWPEVLHRDPVLLGKCPPCRLHSLAGDISVSCIGIRQHLTCACYVTVCLSCVNFRLESYSCKMTSDDKRLFKLHSHDAPEFQALSPPQAVSIPAVGSPPGSRYDDSA